MRRSMIIALAWLCAACETIPPLERQAPRVEIMTEPVELNRSYPGQESLGRLRYLGGVAVTGDRRAGGFSSLKWRGGRLWSVTDAGDWASFRTRERNHRLLGIADLRLADMVGVDGNQLAGGTGDAEAIAWDGQGWLVAFEHAHRILRYAHLGANPLPTGLDPERLFGGLDANQGVEALAANGARIFACAERLATTRANCLILAGGRVSPLSLAGPEGLDPTTAYPVDADWASDGSLYILFRSWSGGNDNRAAIVRRSPDGEMITLAVLTPPITTDNFEGLAVRQHGRRTFIYIISDDNFGVYNVPNAPATWQRTLLMKFELTGG